MPVLRTFTIIIKQPNKTWAKDLNKYFTIYI